jgi:hypothetical protein
MSFLRGKSTSYTRIPLPHTLTVAAIDKAVTGRAFTQIPAGETEETGFCSWRNLLDAPIDSGFLEGNPDLWLTGLRKDVRKAPSALVQAVTAQRMADLRQTVPSPSKAQEKEIKDGVRHELNLKAQARPMHAAVLIDTQHSLMFIDGIASAHPWVSKMMDVDEKAGIYKDPTLNSEFLAWCAWRAAGGVDTPCSPTGDISFREPKDSGASFDGSHNIDALLTYWLGEQHATVASLGLIWAVDHEGDSYNVSLTMSCATLKVSAFEFPEDIRDFPGSLEEKLAQRMGFIMAFETALACEFMAFAAASLEGILPEAFKALVAKPEAVGAK